MVKTVWTYKKRKRSKQAPMAHSIGTQTSPNKYIPTQWDPKILLHRLSLPQNDTRSGNNLHNSISNVIPQQCEVVISQYNDVPKISRLPNNYNIFMKPINNNEKANSTLASGYLSHSESQFRPIEPSTSKQVTTRACRAGPKCYKRLHGQFHSEFDIPILRNDDNSNNSLNNSLTVIHEQAEDTSEPPPQILLANCDGPPVLDVSSSVCEITEPAQLTGLTGFLENPSDVLIEAINEGMLESNSPLPEPLSRVMDNNSDKEPSDNAGDQKRRRNKTVTFEFRDIRTEIVENGENDEATAPNDENDSMEDEDDVRNHLRKRKYIRIFAEKVNIYNHFYN